jgi:hypothetical protein
LCHAGLNFPSKLSASCFALTVPTLPFYGYDDYLSIDVKSIMDPHDDDEEDNEGLIYIHQIINILETSSSVVRTCYTAIYIRDIVAFYFLCHLIILFHQHYHESFYPQVDKVYLLKKINS